MSMNIVHLNQRGVSLMLITAFFASSGNFVNVFFVSRLKGEKQNHEESDTDTLKHHTESYDVIEFLPSALRLHRPLSTQMCEKYFLSILSPLYIWSCCSGTSEAPTDFLGSLTCRYLTPLTLPSPPPSRIRLCLC